MGPKKVIIWGHKLHTHTHSYIHSSYFKAFKSLGFETLWLDKNDSLGSTELEGTLFFSEDQAKAGMPVRDDCFYITHHFDESFLQEVPRDRIIRLGNFTTECKVHERINELCHYDSSSRTIYQPWATDLLPHEIDTFVPRKFNIESKQCFYIGSIYDENLQAISKFANSCSASGIELRHVRNASDEMNISLTRDSLVSMDFRGGHHINVGYLPCRVFKSISYGVPIVTNSRLIKSEIDIPAIHLCEDSSRTLVEGIHFESTLKNDDVLDSMSHVKNKHTFVNRIENLIGVMFK
jgi:hypothetical protein